MPTFQQIVALKMNLTDNTILIIKTAIILFLDYIRYTQLVPMVIIWTFATIMLLALLLISFQGEIDSTMQRTETYVERTIGPAPENSQSESMELGDAEETQTEGSESFRVTHDDIIPWIYRIWGILALLMWVFGIIRTKIRGAPKKKRLKVKLKKLGLAIFAYMAVLLLLLMLIDGTANTRGEKVFAMVLPPILLFIVSCWGLGISHYVGKIQDWVHTQSIGAEEPTAIY